MCLLWDICKCSQSLEFAGLGVHEPVIQILDETHPYGCEFYGAALTAALTPQMSRCFLSMSQTAAVNRGAMLCGPAASGKTQTAKVRLSVGWVTHARAINQTENVLVKNSQIPCVL